jgi:nucleotide-binding universal stress UspA family protein
MFDTIIWATDGSARADRCQHFIRDLGRRYGATVRIVHVVETLPGTASGPAWHGDEERVVAKLKAESVAMRRRGVNASLHVVRGARGQPAAQIADVAAQAGADLIVVSAHGRSELRHRVLMGGVAHRLLEIAPCPVLVLPTALQPISRPATRAPSGSLQPA